MRSTEVRTEIEGFGIICPITEEHLEIRAIPKLDLAQRLFEFANIEAEPSPAGRIATRLIAQLGGLQGARVLKLAGVRRLIKSMAPSKSSVGTLRCKRLAAVQRSIPSPSSQSMKICSSNLVHGTPS